MHLPLVLSLHRYCPDFARTRRGQRVLHGGAIFAGQRSHFGQGMHTSSSPPPGPPKNTVLVSDFFPPLSPGRTRRKSTRSRSTLSLRVCKTPSASRANSRSVLWAARAARVHGAVPSPVAVAAQLRVCKPAERFWFHGKRDNSPMILEVGASLPREQDESPASSCLGRPSSPWRRTRTATPCTAWRRRR